MLLFLVSCGVLAACAALYLYLRDSMTYWQRRRVPVAAATLPWGNFADSILGRKAVFQVVEDIYEQHREERYIGTYFAATPLLHVHDPEIVRQVFIREFQDFNGRGMHCDPENDPLSGHLFLLSGQPWRNMRTKLNPAFTPAKIKYMFHTISECAAQLGEHLDTAIQAGGGRHEEDVRELSARLFTDVISSVAFGIQSNSMKNPESEFRRMGRRIFEPCLDVNVRAVLSFFGGGVMKLFGIRNAPRDVDAFFTGLVDEVVAHREQQGVERADMLNLLIKLKNEGLVPPDACAEQDKSGGACSSGADLAGNAHTETRTKLTQKEIAAQVFAFFIGGYETSSATTSFALFELAKHPDLQDRAIEEVDATLKKHAGAVTYDAVMDMPYLDMVIQETLRMYPPVPFLTREAMFRRQLPLTDVILDKGSRLVIPVSSLHSDPRYWPAPERFDPLRFTEEAKRDRTDFVYMPFGDGPRLCIGMRLGLVQVKAALATVLSRGRVSLAPGMPREVTMSPLSSAIIPTPSGGIRLAIAAR